jgi:hypothetical protein
MNECACGCGTLVAGTWKRGHKAKAEARSRLGLLPGPDVADEDLDLGLIGPPPPVEPPALASVPDDDGDGEDEVSPDPPPGHARQDNAGPRRGRPAAGHGGKVRVTATVRKDIEAKVTIMLIVPGKIWQARDPFCGGTFVDTIPQQAPAWANIICDSPDLVEFFTGAGGAFMKYLELLTILQPVAMAVWAHHVAHTVELVDGPPQPDLASYAA